MGAQTGIAYAYDADFKRPLKRLVETYSKKSGQDDQIGRIITKLNEVKDVMEVNIDTLLDNSTQISVLVDKSEQMEHQAIRFKGGAKGLHSRMWWKNMKMKMMLCCVG